jgi:hypothetical protein
LLILFFIFFDIQIFIGRDLIEAHVDHDQRIGPKDTSYAQTLALGWVIVGEACLRTIT